MRKSALGPWLALLTRHLAPGAIVGILDNRHVEGSSTPVTRSDAEGNTYQVRPLISGETHEVLKNFPAAAELAALLRPVAREATLEETQYYWLLHFTLK